MDDENKMRNKKIKVGIIYFSIIVIVLLLVNYGMNSARNQSVAYSQFKELVRDGRVEQVQMSADGSIAFLVENDNFTTYNTVATENLTTITAYLEEYNVPVYNGYIAQTNIWLTLLLQLGVPVLLGIILWHFISKSMSRGMGDAMSFGKIMRRSMPRMRPASSLPR